jgi:membrane-associated phospholipid phosphatase
MNAESSRLRSTGMTSSDMRAIWPGALLVVYLAGSGVLLLAGNVHVGVGATAVHFGVLLAVAATTWMPSTPSWLRSWAPLLLLLFLYSEMPVLIQAAGHTETLDAAVIGWEQALFGSQPAQSWARANSSVALSEPLHLAYLAYYPIIYAVPAVLWLTDRKRDFDGAVFALLMTFVACFVAYIVFPVAGPRYLWSSAAPDGPFRTLATVLLEARSSRGTAFPSSHVAVACAQSVLALRFFGRRGALIPIVTVGLALGAIYGGFHYAVDVLAGAVLGIVVAISGLLLIRTFGAQANAIAPTYSGSGR